LLTEPAVLGAQILSESPLACPLKGSTNKIQAETTFVVKQEEVTMGASASGVLTLLGLILIGPIIYLVRYLLRKSRGTVSESDYDATSEKREEISSTAYTFSLVGYAIGIGNVWRFPYVISQNGGAAAVVAYLICAVFVAVPLFLYESILGQYTKSSCVTTWTKIRPRYLSFGLAQGFLVFVANTYFTMIIAYTLPYIVAACQDPFPWAENGSSDYFRNTILNKYDNLDDAPSGAGPIQWHLALGLFVLWVTIFLAVAFGKKLLAKVTYVTVIMPVVLMLVLVFRTAFLPGAGDGISFYIGKFEGSKLRDLDVWSTALSQILFSLSPGFGKYTDSLLQHRLIHYILCSYNQSTFSLIT
jgi:SNF family Na+-dependent transporter